MNAGKKYLYFANDNSFGKAWYAASSDASAALFHHRLRRHFRVGSDAGEPTDSTVADGFSIERIELGTPGHMHPSADGLQRCNGLIGFQPLDESRHMPGKYDDTLDAYVATGLKV